MLTPSTCSGSPASSFPGLQKAGRGLGNEATHLSGRTGELCYEVNLQTASGGGMWVQVQLESIKTL